MRKLITILILTLVSLSTNAQDNKQTFKDFSSAQITEREVTHQWTKLNSRIFFNYGNDKNRIKIFIGDLSETYTVINTREGKTQGGFEYLSIDLESDNKELAVMQIFKKTEYGIRIFFNENTYIQISE